MWIYSQFTGKLNRNGSSRGIGYSGHGEGLNNPYLQSESMIGPLPVGKYTIGKAITHPKLGPLVMPLIILPGHETFNRGSFYIHGDNSSKNNTASEGCIILDHNIRFEISKSLDRELTVTK